MTSVPMRILLTAENTSTKMGGEAILPHHYFRLLLQRDVDVHLITHSRSRSDLLKDFPDHTARLHFVEDQWLQKLLFRFGRLLPRRIDEATLGLCNQLLTQLAQRALVRKLTHQRTVVHQVIPVSPRFPSLMFGLDAPVVIGPLNGGMQFPPAFRQSGSLLAEWFISAARWLSEFVNLLLPGKSRAAAILVANQRTRDSLPTSTKGTIHYLPENGVAPEAWPEASTPITPSAPQFVFIGRLVDWKALDIVLEALASVPAASLTVIGDGPMLNAWKQSAATLGVTDRVHFVGWLSQQACAEHLSQSRALVLPSLYECGGAVVLEAMAIARPVIATAWGGPAEYLDRKSGILVAPSSRPAMVDGFAKAMRLLAQDPERARQMGLAGRERALEHYSWPKKIDRVLDIYASVLSSN